VKKFYYLRDAFSSIFLRFQDGFKFSFMWYAPIFVLCGQMDVAHVENKKDQPEDEYETDSGFDDSFVH
jgi:hypothetical protein